MTPPLRDLQLRVAAATRPATVALLVAAASASALILTFGQTPLHVYGLLAVGTWGNAYGLGQVLFKATPLVLTGLAVAIPFKAGLFNVGAEGQAVLGAFACGLVGCSLPAATPWPIALPLCLVAAFAGGALAGLVPGVLKAYRGAHEVIVTIMLNFVILAVLSDVGKHFYLRESVHTAVVVAGAVLPRASTLLPSLRGSALSAALPVALGVAALVWWWLGSTLAGFRLRAVGASAEAAASSGISVARQTVLAMVLGGGLAGLVGANAVLGYKHYYEEGFSGGVGFMGIAVALLGRNHPAGIVVAALVFGTLAQGGLAINALVPRELVDVLQAITILAVAAAGAAGVATMQPRREPKSATAGAGTAGTAGQDQGGE